MRLNSVHEDHSVEELKEFANWILAIGDGKLGDSDDCCSIIAISSELLIREFNDPIEAIVRAIYADYLNNVCNPLHLQGRTILASTINVVEEVNNYMLSLNGNEIKTYVSSNSACFKDGANNTFESIHTPEFLATIKSSSLPSHELQLKKGCLVMLIRNIDHSAGLCNGTRLIVTRLRK
ncbi:uncharacterized protein [Arachis hypogaea]|uniref:uncharacterized protein n=1 Tax=Arachis hypogaea TaxID=3818 RepID=UPI000DEC0F0D